MIFLVFNMKPAVAAPKQRMTPPMAAMVTARFLSPTGASSSDPTEMKVVSPSSCSVKQLDFVESTHDPSGHTAHPPYLSTTEFGAHSVCLAKYSAA